MKKVVVVPDSFKGTISSYQVCEIIENCVSTHFPSCQVVKIPVADGGEGSVDCFLNSVDGEKVSVLVNDPYKNKIEASYGLIDGGKTAVIEMAACAGLPLVEGKENPLETTTYGVGELMLDAANRGCDKIIMCLGGSCTNDMGFGAAAATGVRFFDKEGNSFVPVGETLIHIEKIDISGRDKIFDNIKIVTMCDIDNPLYGEKGAAYVFAPQKGADENQVKFLDEGLRHCADIIKKDLNTDVSLLKGAGAAGGMGAGMAALFDAQLKSGIETVLDTVGFDDKIASADIIFTGEGRLDSQSADGKVISGVAKRARKKNIPVIAVVGGYDENLKAVYDMGVTAVFATNREPVSFEKIKGRSKENLALTVDNILRIIKW